MNATTGQFDFPDLGVCRDYITSSISASGYFLLILSEVLGMRRNKSNKCTSVIQGVSAAALWAFYHLRGRPHPLSAPDPEEEDLDRPVAARPRDPDVESIVSKRLTITRKSKRPRGRVVLTQPAPPAIHRESSRPFTFHL